MITASGNISIIHPLNDRIVVRRLPTKPSRTSRIIIPEVAQSESTRWLVLAVGPGKRNKKGQRIPCDVKPGDKVVLGPYNDFIEGDVAMFQEGDVRYVEC